MKNGASAPEVQDGKGVAVAETKGPVVTFRSPGSHPRGRDEEGGSDKRTSVAEQQDKGPDPDLGRRHASALLPLTSAARFRPPREGPSDFSRDIETLSSLSFSFLGTRRVQSSLYRDSCSLLDSRLSDTSSRAPGHRNLDTSSSTNVGPHVPHLPHFSATAPRSPPREVHATYMTPRLYER